jgi:hypothetical protein
MHIQPAVDPEKCKRLQAFERNQGQTKTTTGLSSRIPTNMGHAGAAPGSQYITQAANKINHNFLYYFASLSDI